MKPFYDAEQFVVTTMREQTLGSMPLFLLNVFGDIVGWHRERKRRLQCARLSLFKRMSSKIVWIFAGKRKETHDTDQPQHVVCCLSSRVERLVRNIILLLKLSDSYKRRLRNANSGTKTIFFVCFNYVY